MRRPPIILRVSVGAALAVAAGGVWWLARSPRPAFPPLPVLAARLASLGYLPDPARPRYHREGGPGDCLVSYFSTVGTPQYHVGVLTAPGSLDRVVGLRLRLWSPSGVQRDVPRRAHARAMQELAGVDLAGAEALLTGPAIARQSRWEHRTHRLTVVATHAAGAAIVNVLVADRKAVPQRRCWGDPPVHRTVPPVLYGSTVATPETAPRFRFLRFVSPFASVVFFIPYPFSLSAPRGLRNRRLVVRAHWGVVMTV
jgi:hypothetical protein